MNRKNRRARSKTLRHHVPDPTTGLLAQAIHHQRRGELNRASQLFRSLLANAPEHFEALHSLGIVALQSGRAEQAYLLFKRAVRLSDQEPGYHSNLGIACKQTGRIQEAVEAYRKALACAPGHAQALSNLAFALREKGLYGMGIRACERVLRLQPEFADAENNFGNLLQEQGRLDEAVSAFERALQIIPGLAGAGMNLIFAHLYRPDVTLAEIRSMARDWCNVHAGNIVRHQARLPQPGDDRRLPSVGFVSADFRSHAVGLLVLPALRSLVKTGYRVACYSMNGADDYLTEQFKSLAALWRPIRDLGDDALAETIRHDAIDILIDLSGFSYGNRLLALARKPAPIQVTWLGCPCTTGLKAMDYILADWHQIPQGAESHYSEAVVRLPDSYTAFAPPPDAPASGPLPAATRGWVTFGSFNTLKKITANVVAAWSTILASVPNSRILLKAPGFNCDETRQRFVSMFAERGIDPARLHLLGGSPRDLHLAAMRDVDIALDSFPYSGGQTTLECLWMGLPVVSLVGETFAGRHTLSYLTSIGLGDLAATDVDGYVARAVKLAGDLAALAALRDGMRARMLASPLADVDRFGLYLQAALSRMWQRWCSGLGPSSFSIQVTGDRDYAAALDLYHRGRLDEADGNLCRLLSMKSDHADAWHCRALVACRRDRPGPAIELAIRAVILDPSSAPFFATLGYACRGAEFTDRAVGAYGRALRVKPDFAQASSNRGNALRDLGFRREAEQAFRGAICADPGYADAFANLALCLNDGDAPSAALTAARIAVVAAPASTQAHFAVGLSLLRLDRARESARSYHTALALSPGYADALANLGNAQRQEEPGPKSMDAFRRAIRARPDLSEAYYNLGNELLRLERSEEAAAAYHAAICLKPDFVGALYHYVHCQRVLCLWRGFERKQRHFMNLIGFSHGDVPPFTLLTLDSTLAEQRRVAELWAAAQATGVQRLPPAARVSRRKIRLGYLSPDFRNHAVAYLAAELYERHDRDRFEVFAFSYGPDDKSPMRARLMAAFDKFSDIAGLSDHEAALAIRDAGIDILIDLAGHTKDARARILAYRPAPIQVNFLGYPGTMGGDFIDYIIADPVCIAAGQEIHFSEQVVRLPDCYQPNDSKRSISPIEPSRADCGLPPDGFVFCCFNNSFKILPAVFDRWMRILGQVPGGVLWLIHGNAEAERNLKREAAARRIDPDRLIFALKLPHAEHLARYRLADLFLDTIPYNAHTTASDALWAGVPVLTCVGQTFAARVAASLLTAIKAPPGLIAETLDEYQATAIELAHDSQRLAAIRAAIQANRDTAPLFDIGRFTGNIETAYGRMWDLYCRGRPPEPITL
jgi:predicted O-linked N-acetylglucosamine transferase (SPINDLY family)